MDPIIVGRDTLLFLGENANGLQLEASSTVPVSPTGTARIRYTPGSGLEASINGGAYGGFGSGAGWQIAAGNITPADPTYDIQLGAGNVMTIGGNLQFSNDINHFIRVNNQTVDGAAGKYINLHSSDGGAATASVIGGMGGAIYAVAGDGGVGSATKAAGTGGTIYLSGGDAGANGGGGGANGGSVYIYGGAGTGAGFAGNVNIGVSNTAGIGLGNITQNTTIYKYGSGTSTWNGPMVMVNDASVGGDFTHGGAGLGFYGTAAQAKPTVVGAKGGNAALTNLLTALATLGLLTDSTT